MQLGEIVAFHADPTIVITLYLKGKIDYIEAHSLIIDCCDLQALRFWSIELVNASKDMLKAAVVIPIPIPIPVPVPVPVKAAKVAAGLIIKTIIEGFGKKI